MFGFLKKKIKEVSEKVAEEIEEDKDIIEEVSEDELSEDEKQEIIQEEEKVKKGFFQKIFSKKSKDDISKDEQDNNMNNISEDKIKSKESDTSKNEETESEKQVQEKVEEEKVEKIESGESELDKKNIINEIKSDVVGTEKVEAVIEKKIEEKSDDVSDVEEEKVEEDLNDAKVNEDTKQESEIKTLPKKDVPENEVHITYFVHSTSTDNLKDVHSGHSNPDLSDLGIQQANELKQKLKYDFDVIFTSDLQRAIHTSNIIWPNSNKITDKRLRECDYGILNGQSKLEHEKWKNSHNPIYDHYPRGENYNDVTSRIRKFLNDLYKKYKGKHVAIVAHRYSQLAMEVLLNNNSWTNALADDWRLRQDWQPGWEYKITHKIEKHKETKKSLERLPEPEKPKKIIEESSTKSKSELSEKLEDPTKKKKNIFTKLTENITKLKITDEKFDELFWDLEVALLENNVAMEVIEKIKDNLKEELKSTKVTKRSIIDIILNNLKHTIESLFDYEQFDLISKIKESEKPYKILFLGVNGSGKTTTLAKIVQKLKDNNLTSVIAASDTFRAAAIQQLEEHANNLNTKLIKHDYGADPASVAYDAIEHAKSKNLDVVLIDTAGRLHSNSNLMDELHKIIRVAKPDIKIFIGESITGNDCVEQATKFNEAVGIDAIILTKADIDEKGGAAISISHVTGKPIIYITTGQEYKDLKEFNSQEIIDTIFN